jgi:hypothetical protein
METRVRIPPDTPIGSLSPLDLLKLYWDASHEKGSDPAELNQLATQVIREVHGEGND